MAHRNMQGVGGDIGAPGHARTSVEPTGYNAHLEFKRNALEYGHGMQSKLDGAGRDGFRGRNG